MRTRVFAIVLISSLAGLGLRAAVGPPAARPPSAPLAPAAPPEPTTRPAATAGDDPSRPRSTAVAPAELLRIALRPGAVGEAARLRDRASLRLRRLGAATLELLPSLLDAMETGTREVRNVAARIAAGAAVAAEEAGETESMHEALRAGFPRLRRILENEETAGSVRRDLMTLAGIHGPGAAELAPMVVHWIQESERTKERFRRECPTVLACGSTWELDLSAALSAFGPGALPAILAAVRAEEAPAGEFWLERAIEGMGRVGESQLRELLSDRDAGIRAAALTALSNIGRGETETLALLRGAALDASGEVREAAVGGMRDWGERAAEDLLAALADPDEDVRSAAARGLEEAPEAARRARPRLLDMLATGTYGERLAVMDTLAMLGPDAADATPGLLDVVGEYASGAFDREGEFRKVLGPLGRAAVPHLTRLVAGEDARLRALAVDALLVLDSVRPEDVRPLAETLPRLGGADRMKLAGLLARAGEAAGTTALCEGLDSGDVAVRIAAADGLSHAGADAIAALPKLVEGVRIHQARWDAAGAQATGEWPGLDAYRRAVGNVGSHAPAGMIALLGDECEGVRESAARALRGAGAAGVAAAREAWGGLGVAARRLLAGSLAPLAPTALGDEDAGVRLAAAKAVLDDPDLRPRALDALVDLLLTDAGEPGRKAAWRLTGFAARLGPYEARLRAASRDASDGAVRRRIRNVLDAIEDATVPGR